MTTWDRFWLFLCFILILTSTGLVFRAITLFM